MRDKSLFKLPFLAGLIIVLSLIVFIINHFLYKFHGNNFFPDGMLVLTSIILITNYGLILLFGKNTRISHSGIQFFYFFAIMSIIAFASNAIQLTPFAPIDKHIYEFELALNINSAEIVAWTNQHPVLKDILGFVYDTLPYQMSILPLIIIALGRFELVKEYYFLLLFTALIGFGFYYFFPTTAPASIINSPYFSTYQTATGLKFYQIHHYIIPTTSEGGLIALPSFHTIWALLSIYLFKEWAIPFILLLILNSVLVASCIMLGWHYPIDILGAFVVLAISFYALRYYRRSVGQRPNQQFASMLC